MIRNLAEVHEVGMYIAYTIVRKTKTIIKEQKTVSVVLYSTVYTVKSRVEVWKNKEKKQWDDLHMTLKISINHVTIYCLFSKLV